MSILEFLQHLFSSEDARQDFAEDPQASLDAAGLGHLSSDDVHEAITLMHDDSQSADFSRDTDSGAEVNIAAPEPPAPDQPVTEYITEYVTNNFIDDRDVNIDNSVNQQIDTGGGDFDQNIDIDSTVAAGDGAVAAGDDISGDVNTGDGNTIGDGNVSGEGNIVGDDNEVAGEGSTASFGSGDATSTDVNGDINADDGSSIGIGGDSAASTTDNSISDSGNDNSQNTVEDSFNNTTETTDNDEYSYEDSFNQSDDDTATDNSTDNDSQVIDA
jgi:hypothetical protein